MLTVIIIMAILWLLVTLTNIVILLRMKRRLGNVQNFDTMLMTAVMPALNMVLLAIIIKVQFDRYEKNMD